MRCELKLATVMCELGFEGASANGMLTIIKSTKQNISDVSVSTSSN